MASHYGETVQNSGLKEQDWDSLNSLVALDPDNFENWENLVHATESLDGGIGRNSRPEVIEKFRAVFDSFLARFPLLFGYWKRYADIEFAIGGSDVCELIYERAIAGIPNSVELWTCYCSFKMETCPDEDRIRDLFEMAANFIGLDFLSHPFWDKYIEFEERMDHPQLVCKILQRLVHIPLHQYARFFEKFNQVAAVRPVEELVSAEVLDQLKRDTIVEGNKKTEYDLERDLRIKIHSIYAQIYAKVQHETTLRWPFEAEIKRPYFHVKPLEETELIYWRKYLDFEEVEGDQTRIRYLYEKCLVSTALYDEFWLRYIRWLSGQGCYSEEIRNVYRRACSLFVPAGRLAIRVGYAHFEESKCDHELSRDIYDAILLETPGNIETIIAYANMERRVTGCDAAINVYKNAIQSNSCDVYCKGALIAEWARLLWMVVGSPERARKLFEENTEKYLDSRYFWINYLQFEIAIQSSAEREPERHKYISKIHKDIRERARLPPNVVKDLSHIYMVYLLERGGSEVMKEYQQLDIEVNGPFSVQRTHKRRLAEDGQEETTNKNLKKRNGRPIEPIEESLIYAMDIGGVE
ncbi:hypothetical protein V1511DRAFT_25211 [Dipodascopsis uninucleata]